MNENKAPRAVESCTAILNKCNSVRITVQQIASAGLPTDKLIEELNKPGAAMKFNNEINIKLG